MILALPPPVAVVARLERGSLGDTDLTGYQIGARWRGEWLRADLAGSLLDDAWALVGGVGVGLDWWGAAVGVRATADAIAPTGRLRLGPRAVHLFGAWDHENPVWTGICAMRLGLGVDWKGFEGFVGYGHDVTDVSAGTLGVRAPLGARLGLYVNGALAPGGGLVRMGVGVGWVFGGEVDPLPDLPVDGPPDPLRGRPPLGQPPPSQPPPSQPPPGQPGGPSVPR